MSETAQGPNRAERRRMVKKNQIKGCLFKTKRQKIDFMGAWCSICNLLVVPLLPGPLFYLDREGI